MLYLEILLTLKRKLGNPSCIEEDREILITNLVTFKNNESFFFANYRASAMGTLKWRMLDQVVRDLEDVTEIGFLRQECSKAFFKISKSAIEGCLYKCLQN